MIPVRLLSPCVHESPKNEKNLDIPLAGILPFLLELVKYIKFHHQDPFVNHRSHQKASINQRGRNGHRTPENRDRHPTL